MTIFLIASIFLAAWVINPAGPFILYTMLSSWWDDIKSAREAKKEKKEG